LADAFVPKGSTVGTLADVVHGLIERVGRRAATRHPFSTPLIVRAHRPGVSTAASSGRSFDLSETGIGGELDSPLLPGQVVAMSIQLQHAAERVNAAARVAYRNGLRHGFQFLALSASQRALLRSALAQRGPASN
jgi:hypothetical protein